MTQWCYLLCNRKAEIIKGIPMAWILGVPLALGTSVHCGRRLLATEIRAELEQCLCLASLEQLCQLNHEQEVPSLAAATGRVMFSFQKKLVWLEAVGLYFCVWCNFAGEIHGVTGVPRRHVDAHSCQHWYSLRGQNVCMKPELYLVNKEKFSYIWANKCQLHLSCVMFCSDIVEPDLIL